MSEMIISPLPDAWKLSQGLKEDYANYDLDLLANLIIYAVVHTNDPTTFMRIHELDNGSQDEIGKLVK